MIVKDQLIDELDHAHEAMRLLLQSLNTSQEVYPTWTVKELLAHLTGWDDASIASLQAHSHGDIPSTPASRGIDPYNASTVNERVALSLEQVIREWEQTREVLKQVIRDLPDERLSKELVFPWGPKGSVEELIGIFAEHELEHVEEIRGNLARGLG